MVFVWVERNLRMPSPADREPLRGSTVLHIFRVDDAVEKVVVIVQGLGVDSVQVESPAL